MGSREVEIISKKEILVCDKCGKDCGYFIKCTFCGEIFGNCCAKTVTEESSGDYDYPIYSYCYDCKKTGDEYQKRLDRLKEIDWKLETLAENFLDFYRNPEKDKNSEYIYSEIEKIFNQ